MNNYISTLICSEYFTVSIDIEDNLCFFGSISSTSDDESGFIFPPKKIDNLVNISSVSCGDSHIICCNNDGLVWSFGSNINGILGLGTTKEFKTFTPQLISIPPIKHVCCGSDFTLCLSYDETIYSFGRGTSGRLGLGNEDDYSSPQLINNLNNICSIECGGHSSFCKTNSGDYYAWGKGVDGQLGLEEQQDIYEPKLVTSWPNDIISVKSSDGHTLLLSENGIVYSCGKNLFGQLGLGKDIDKQKLPTKIEGLPTIKLIDVGFLHSICIDIEGYLWVFGCDVYGQLGLDGDNKHFPKKHEEIENIIASNHEGYVTMVKTKDNKIYGIGTNKHSELGIPASNYVTKPARILINYEDIWGIKQKTSRQKSARK